jgi:CheY-like chemotaxis protein
MSKRILVVDDSQYVADASARLIAICGYETKAVYGGQEAIEQSLAFAPDMVLMDIGMPGLDGYALLRAIRALSSDAGTIVPAVAVTAYAGPMDGQLALAAGYRLHLSKPVDQEDLIAAVAELAGRRRPAQRRAR